MLRLIPVLKLVVSLQPTIRRSSLPDWCVAYGDVAFADEQWPPGSIKDSLYTLGDDYAYAPELEKLYGPDRLRNRTLLLAFRGGDVYIRRPMESRAFVEDIPFVATQILAVQHAFGDRVPDADLIFEGGDTNGACLKHGRGLAPCFTFSSRTQNLSVIGWPNPYTAKQLGRERKVGHLDVPWFDRQPKAYWRGMLTLYDDEVDIENAVRVRLIRLFEQHPELLDIAVTDIDDGSYALKRNREARKTAWTIMKKYGKRPERAQTHMPLYRYILNVDGIAASWRGYEQLSMGCVLLLQASVWAEYFYRDLVPWKHYVPIKEDLSDLIPTLEWLEEHPDKGEAIAQEGMRYAREMLTPEGIECYIAKSFEFMSRARGYKLADEAELQDHGFELFSRLSTLPKELHTEPHPYLHLADEDD